MCCPARRSPPRRFLESTSLRPQGTLQTTPHLSGATNTTGWCGERCHWRCRRAVARRLRGVRPFAGVDRLRACVYHCSAFPDTLAHRESYLSSDEWCQMGRHGAAPPTIDAPSDSNASPTTNGRSPHASASGPSSKRKSHISNLRAKKSTIDGSKRSF